MALLWSALFVPIPAHAALPELRIAPLRYDQHLELGHPKAGTIDASNPTGSTIHVRVQVQAFRQVNDKGELEYYDDERIAAAVTPAVSEFDLGPREAVRTHFNIDPNKLGPGGSYGVVFLRTADPNAAPGQINTSARVGTLLLLDVGSGGTKSGRITALTAPHFLFGSPSLNTDFSYTNNGTSQQSLAFAPGLTAKLGWWAKPQPLAGPFVFPGRTRQSAATLPLDNRLGFLPLTLADASGGSAPMTRWVLVVTGFWTWLLPLTILILLALIALGRWKSSPLHFPKKHRG